MLYDEVTGQIHIARSMANAAYADAMDFLERLATYVDDFSASEILPIDLDAIADPNITVSLPSVPIMDSYTLQAVTFPDPFVPGTISGLDLSTIGTAPTFDMTAPVISIPAAPGALNITPPQAPQDIQTNFDFPTAPTASQLTIPNPPTFTTLDIPVLQTLNIPTYSYDIPTFTGIDAPDAITNYTEVAYSSTLLEKVQEELLKRISEVGTGINPIIERNLWDRAKDREESTTNKGVRTLAAAVAAKGWRMPSGTLLSATKEMLIEQHNKLIDLSREIAARQMELQYDNLKSSISQSIQLEGILIDHSDKVWNRALELEKISHSLAVDIYRAKLDSFKIQIELVSAYDAAFKTRLQAELTKLDVFKGLLEAQKVKNDINESYVKLYLAQIDSIKGIVDIYKTQVDAVNTRVGVEALKLQNFKTLVDVYTAQVSAKRDEYSMYSEQVKAETSKIGIYDSYAKAFTSRMQAYSIGFETAAKKVDVEIDVEKMRLTEYSTRLDAAVKNLTIQQQLVATLAEKYKAQIAGFTAQIQGQEAINDSKLKIFDYNVKQADIEANVSLKNAEIRLKNLELAAGTLLESIKAGASISTQLAAASLSGMNISAQVAGHSSTNHNDNYNYEM